MMKHAWAGYKKHAWGDDELAPISRTGRRFFGSTSLALTMFDAMDTLLIMGLEEEFIEAKEYIISNVTFDKVL